MLGFYLWSYFSVKLLADWVRSRKLPEFVWFVYRLLLEPLNVIQNLFGLEFVDSDGCYLAAPA